MTGAVIIKKPVHWFALLILEYFVSNIYRQTLGNRRLFRPRYTRLNTVKVLLLEILKYLLAKQITLVWQSRAFNLFDYLNFFHLRVSIHCSIKPRYDHSLWYKVLNRKAIFAYASIIEFHVKAVLTKTIIFSRRKWKPAGEKRK